MVYPEHAGFTDRYTSKQAAEKITPKLRKWHNKVLELFLRDPYNVIGITGFEATMLISKELGADPDNLFYTIRPRLRELYDYGMLDKTMTSRKNKRGNNEVVWKRTDRQVPLPQKEKIPASTRYLNHISRLNWEIQRLHSLLKANNIDFSK